MLGHLISFRTAPERILFWDKDELAAAELSGKKVSMKFSESVLCTGYQALADETGKEEGDAQTEENVIPKTFRKCPHKFKGRKQCYHCRNMDISKIYTRLDFEGFEELHDAYVKQDFSLYLAQFGDSVLKCGVTRSERLEERTREQGADFWCEVMRFSDGETAYMMEAELQNRFGLRDFVRNDTKLAMLLQKNKAPGAIEGKINEMKASGLAGKLAGCEIRENKFDVPENPEISYSVDGVVTGSKSQMLFFKRDGKDYVVPMYSAIGRVFLLKE